jgi:exonuclease VII large subunit
LVDPKQALTQIGERFSSLGKKFDFLVQNFFEKKIQKLSSTQISTQLLFSKINMANQKVDFAFDRLKSITERRLKENFSKLENLSKLLKTNNYHEVLKRGFALVKKHYPEYWQKAQDLAERLDLYWGRSEQDFYTTFGRKYQQDGQTCSVCAFD